MTKEAPKSDLTVVTCWFLLVALLILKLTGVISWSWWWVLAPLWIPAAGVLLLLGFIAVIALLGGFDCFDF